MTQSYENRGSGNRGQENPSSLAPGNYRCCPCFCTNRNEHLQLFCPVMHNVKG